MARPLKPAEIRAAFKKWGVPHNLVPGWETRDNGSNWSDRKSVTGCMWHHTAGDASDAAELRVIRDGRVGLSGPLANFGVTDTGRIDVVAAGSANHAGKGDPDTLRLVQNESYTGNITPNQNANSGGAVGGNSRFYGWETYYGIRNDPTVNAIQYRVLVLATAAIIDALDEVDTANRWTAKSVIGHKEWTTNKIDPSGISMSAGRADVQWCLDHGPVAALAWYRTGTKPATAPTPQEDDMQLSDKVNVRDPETGDVVQVPYSTILARQDWVYQETIRQKAMLDAIAAKLLTPDEVKAAAKAALDERISGATTVLEVKP